MQPAAAGFALKSTKPFIWNAAIVSRPLLAWQEPDQATISDFAGFGFGTGFKRLLKVFVAFHKSMKSKESWRLGEPLS